MLRHEVEGDAWGDGLIRILPSGHLLLRKGRDSNYGTLRLVPRVCGWRGAVPWPAACILVETGERSFRARHIRNGPEKKTSAYLTPKQVFVTNL